MTLRPFWFVILLAGNAALAHEQYFPLPLLAQGTAVPETSASTTPVRPKQQPDQVLPLRPTRRISFETDEGTWMSLDRSPDGARLVFDLPPGSVEEILGALVREGFLSRTAQGSFRRS